MNSPFAFPRWEALFSDWRILLDGFLNTVAVSALALLLALALGIVFGLFSTSHSRLLHGVDRVYVEIFQNTPLLIQLFFFFNGLPYLGIVLPVFLIGVLGVGLYHGAYISEVVRAGIESVPDGQMEAAISQGFTYGQAMRWIVLPQAVRVILPALANQAVNLIKNTSVMAMIAGGELMYTMDSWAGTTLNYGPAYLTAGILYFLLDFPLTRLARRLEKNADKSKKTQPAPLELEMEV
jgi:aspartate/glutamate/glutamine transport system permease protein